MGGLWPATSGGRIRSLHTLSHLSARHQVTVVTTHGPDDDPTGLAHRLPHCRRVVSLPFAAPKAGSAAFVRALARSWLSRYPVDLWKWRLPAMREQVRTLLAEGQFDICVADFLVAAANLPQATPVPIVLFEHNVEHLIWQRLATLERRVARRTLLEIEWRKLRRYEAAVCAAADLTIAVSDEDREHSPMLHTTRELRRSRPASTPRTSRPADVVRSPIGSCSPARWIGTRTKTPCSTSATRSCRASAPRSQRSRSPSSAAIQVRTSPHWSGWV